MAATIAEDAARLKCNDPPGHCMKAWSGPTGRDLILLHPSGPAGSAILSAGGSPERRARTPSAARVARGRGCFVEVKPNGYHLGACN